MYIVLFVTVPHKKEAHAIARQLVERKAAACVNIIDTVESIFTWKGKIEKSHEALLIIKSKKTLLPRIKRLIISLHSYEVPEIIALPIHSGHRPYLKWIDESVR